jgi:chromosome segregation ATPase
LLATVASKTIEVAKVQRDKADLADRVAKEESRVIKGQKSLADLHSNYIKTLEDKWTVGEDNAKLQSDNADLQERNATMMNVLSEESRRVARADEEMTEMGKRLADSKSANKSLKNKLKEIEAERDTLARKFAELEQASNRQATYTKRLEHEDSSRSQTNEQQGRPSGDDRRSLNSQERSDRLESKP